jgi:DNA repair protein RecO
MIVETEAIVLQVRKFSDSSKIIIFFSKEFGKISMIAKGAFSAKSRFGGALEPLSFVNISFYKKNTDLHLLKNVELIKIFNNIAKNYDSLISGLIISEMINHTQKENFINFELFDFFTNFLQELNENIDFSFSICVLFLFKLADNLGFSVDFSFINELQENNFAKKNNSIETIIISLENNSYIISNDFIYKNDKFFHINFATLVKIFDLKNSNALEIKLTSAEFSESVNFFAKFFSFHLGKKITIKSLNLIT